MKKRKNYSLAFKREAVALKKTGGELPSGCYRNRYESEFTQLVEAGSIAIL